MVLGRLGINFGWLGFLIYFGGVFKRNLQNDPAFARRLKAVKEARKGFGPGRGVYFDGQDQRILCAFIKSFTGLSWLINGISLQRL